MMVKYYYYISSVSFWCKSIKSAILYWSSCCVKRSFSFGFFNPMEPPLTSKSPYREQWLHIEVYMYFHLSHGTVNHSSEMVCWKEILANIRSQNSLQMNRRGKNGRWWEWELKINSEDVWEWKVTALGPHLYKERLKLI